MTGVVNGLKFVGECWDCSEQGDGERGLHRRQKIKTKDGGVGEERSVGSRRARATTGVACGGCNVERRGMSKPTNRRRDQPPSKRPAGAAQTAKPFFLAATVRENRAQHSTRPSRAIDDSQRSLADMARRSGSSTATVAFDREESSGTGSGFLSSSPGASRSHSSSSSYKDMLLRGSASRRGGWRELPARLLPFPYV